MKRNKNFNIRKLKQKELNSNKDAKLNRSLLNRKKKKDNIAGRRLEKDSKTKKYQLNKKGEIGSKKVEIAISSCARYNSNMSEISMHEKMFVYGGTRKWES